MASPSSADSEEMSDVELKLEWFSNARNSQSVEAELGAVFFHRNCKRLEIAHSLGVMPDCVRGLVGFNKETGHFAVKGLPNGYGNPTGGVGLEPDVLAKISPRLLNANPDTLFGGARALIAEQINEGTLSMADREANKLLPVGLQNVIRFEKTSGLIAFQGLKFDVPAFEFEAEAHEASLWQEFREYLAKYKHSNFIRSVWEPLQIIQEGQMVGDDKIVESVSHAIKSHYEMIALVRVLLGYWPGNEQNEDDSDYDAAGDLEANFSAIGCQTEGLDYIEEVRGRLATLTHLNGVGALPEDMLFLETLLTNKNWETHYKKTGELLDDLVEKYCPEAPRIAAHLLEKHGGVSVTLDADSFCPFMTKAWRPQGGDESGEEDEMEE